MSTIPQPPRSNVNNANSHVVSTAQVFEKRAKPADRMATARLDDLLPSDSLYFELSQYERQIDRHILQKQMRIADAAFKGPKIKRVLRVSIYNFAHDQPGMGKKEGVNGPYSVFSTDDNDGDLLSMCNSNTFSTKLVPSWTLRIEGRLEAKAGRPSHAANRKFSSFLKSLIIQIGDSGDDIVEWKRVTEESFDGFEVKRKGDKPVPVKVIIEMENLPEKFKMSPALSDLLSPSVQSTSATRPHIILAMWRYVKLNKLQESDEKKVISCDGPLQKLFNGATKCTFSELPALIDPHLSPLDPIEIDYEIALDSPISHSSYMYEIPVDIDDPMRSTTRPLSSPLLYNLQVDLDSCTLRLRDLTETLRASVHNLKLLEEFGKDPVGFVQRTYQTQCEDVSTIIRDAKICIGDLFNHHRYEEDDVEAAVNDLVNSIAETNIQE